MSIAHLLSQQPNTMSLKESVLERFIVPEKNTTSLVLLSFEPDLFARFLQSLKFFTNLKKVSHTKFHSNQSSGSRADPCGRKERLANSLKPFQSKRVLLWRLNIAGNSKT
jgi:hypothetical protein